MANPYATTDDFKNYLLSSGLVIKGDPEEWEKFFTFEREVDRAANALEQATGRVFVATPKVRHYDLPCNPRLNVRLRDDLLSVNAFTWGSKTLVADVDYFLLPDDADQSGQPFTLIQMADVYRAWTLYPDILRRKKLTLDGVFGRMATPNAAIIGAVLAKAAELCVPRLSLAITKGLMSWSAVDGRREEYAHYGDQVPLSAERRMWQADFAEVVQDYLRVEVM